MDEEELEDGKSLEPSDVDIDSRVVSDSPAKPTKLSERITTLQGERQLADAPRERVSVNERLAQMQEKAISKKSIEKPDKEIGKGKEDTL
jgi:hypothetical protein